MDKRLIKKLIPVTLTGAYLIWLIYILIDKNNLSENKLFIGQFSLCQLSIIGPLIYRQQYNKWHLAKRLTISGIRKEAIISNIKYITPLIGFSQVRITYSFNDDNGNEYSRIVTLSNIANFRKYFNILLQEGGKIDVIYDPKNPKDNLIIEETTYANSKTTF